MPKVIRSPWVDIILEVEIFCTPIGNAEDLKEIMEYVSAHCTGKALGNWTQHFELGSRKERTNWNPVHFAWASGEVSPKCCKWFQPRDLYHLLGRSGT